MLVYAVGLDDEYGSYPNEAIVRGSKAIIETLAFLANVDEVYGLKRRHFVQSVENKIDSKFTPRVFGTAAELLKKYKAELGE